MYTIIIHYCWLLPAGHIPALVELAAQAVACHIPFEIVEQFYPPIPDQLQLRIAFWSFPESEEDIRYSVCSHYLYIKWIMEVHLCL